MKQKIRKKIKTKTKYRIGLKPLAEKTKFNRWLANGVHRELNMLIVDSLWKAWQTALPKVR